VFPGIHRYGAGIGIAHGVGRSPPFAGIGLAAVQDVGIMKGEAVGLHLKRNSLNLHDNRLTELKGLEKPTELNELLLGDNPDITKSQIAELKNAT
jgi:hypothetical protein